MGGWSQSKIWLVRLTLDRECILNIVHTSTKLIATVTRSMWFVRNMLGDTFTVTMRSNSTMKQQNVSFLHILQVCSMANQVMEAFTMHKRSSLPMEDNRSMNLNSAEFKLSQLLTQFKVMLLYQSCSYHITSVVCHRMRDKEMN